MFDEAYDTRLRSYIQGVVSRLPDNQRKKLHSLEHCSKWVMDFDKSFTPGVFVLSNGERSKFHGTAACKNSWYCPTCAHVKMAMYAERIACAIDAIKNLENQIPFMATFTVPHSRDLSCENVFDLLYNTWKKFIRYGNDIEGKRKHMTGNDIFVRFCREFRSKHRIRCTEVTYGKNGWHPHFHVLFWVDANKFQLVKGWEESFLQHWMELCEVEIAKIFKAKGYADYTNRYFWNGIHGGSKGVHFSVDQKGKLVEMKSSNYICGWGADLEMTGNFNDKATHEGHYSMPQLLASAADGNKLHEHLYIEYCLTVNKYRRARVSMSSQSGIGKLIKKWKQTQEYRRFTKKNVVPAMEVVYWFSHQQWSLLCRLDRYLPMLSNILYLAKLPDATEQISYYVRLFGIEPMPRMPELDSQIDNVNDLYYNYANNL